MALEAAPYAVLAVEEMPRGIVPRLFLSDGTVEPLDPASLRLGDDGVLRCVVKGDREAQFTRAGQLALGARLEEDPPGSGSYTLLVNGRPWPVRRPR